MFSWVTLFFLSLVIGVGYAYELIAKVLVETLLKTRAPWPAVPRLHVLDEKPDGLECLIVPRTCEHRAVVNTSR